MRCDLNKADTCFVGEMLFGMMIAQDVKLIKVSVNAQEDGVVVRNFCWKLNAGSFPNSVKIKERAAAEQN